MTNNKVLAIITARGGSKGVYKKNIHKLNNKPLIAYTIEAAQKSSIFESVFVSTDNTEIKNIASILGASTIDRPDYLATDSASSIDVITHTLNALTDLNFTHFMLLQPTSPLRNEAHIKEAWDIFNSNPKSATLVSVTEELHTPFKLLIREKEQIKPLFKLEHLTKPRQELPQTYRINGAIYISRLDTFLDTQNLFTDPLDIYNMGHTESIDIDTIDDFRKVESILSKPHLP